MNKLSFVFVFVCGVTFSGVVTLLRNWLNVDSLISYKKSNLEVALLHNNVDLALMDQGFIEIINIKAHYEDEIEKKVKSSSTELEERSSEVEALNSLKVAKELVTLGRQYKAGKLLQHAHSLAPKHHDVLLTYGEYLEKFKEDIVQADQMFLKALAISPTSSKALQNRRRTRPLVEKLDSSVLVRIDDKRDELTRIPSLSSALRRIKKEAYFHHIYHSAAIEGNTLTLAQIRSILETGISVGGKSITEHNEILGLDLALRYINTTLVHRVGKITLSDILEIHRRVLGHVDPIEGGKLRTTQVFVSDHVPPPPSKLQLLMLDFVLWLNSNEAQDLHPIKYAALAHQKLTFIHPFVDGNGRTARLLMNFLLMQAGYPPVIIRKQDRQHYYNQLQVANDGDTRPFIRFVAHCTEKTIDVYLWATKDHYPELEQQYYTGAAPSSSHLEGKTFSASGHLEEKTPVSSFSLSNIDESFSNKNSMNTGFSMEGEEMPSSQEARSTSYYLHSQLHEDSPVYSSSSGSSNYQDDDHQDINGHLWLNGKDEESSTGTGSTTSEHLSRIMEQSDIFDTMKGLDRMKNASPSRPGFNRSPGT